MQRKNLRITSKVPLIHTQAAKPNTSVINERINNTTTTPPATLAINFFC